MNVFPLFGLSRIAPLAAVPLCLTGCFGGGDGPSIVPVSGVVTIGGEPAENISLLFKPVSGGAMEPGPTSAGRTDAGGRYFLKPMVGSVRRGAVVGTHQVIIEGAEAVGRNVIFVDPADHPGKTSAELGNPTVEVPEEAREPRTFEVPAGGTDAADFAL